MFHYFFLLKISSIPPIAVPTPGNATFANVLTGALTTFQNFPRPYLNFYQPVYLGLLVISV